jgi:hypothetical protein
VCLPTQGPRGLLEKPYLKVPAAVAVSETSNAGSVAGQTAASTTVMGKVSSFILVVRNREACSGYDVVGQVSSLWAGYTFAYNTDQFYLS